MAAKETVKTAQPKKISPAEQLRQRKIASYQARISHDEETITAMEAGRDALAKTDIVGLAVAHKLFGNGSITEQNQTTITVKFNFGNKRFLMPSAFVDGFLTTEDAETSSKFSQYQEMGAQIKAARDDICVVNRAIKILASKS